MVTYELAKRLKEAGFPQGRASSPVSLEVPSETEVRYPSLSELIEACGDACFKVCCMPGRYVVAREASEAMEECSTPEEAVANLWIELEKKLKK